MTSIPVAASGAITVALIVVLGIFVFPALLRRPMGRWVVAIVTPALMALFFLFDTGSGLSSYPLVSAIAIGLAPLLAGTVVYRLERGKLPESVLPRVALPVGRPLTVALHVAPPVEPAFGRRADGMEERQHLRRLAARGGSGRYGYFLPKKQKGYQENNQ